MRTPIQVKLGTGNVKRGFYSNDVAKAYTEIQEDKIAHNTLKSLARDNITIGIGLLESQLHNLVTTAQPELSTDTYGYSTTLPSLIKDLEEGNLVEVSRNPTKFKITAVGVDFLNNNVIPKGE